MADMIHFELVSPEKLLLSTEAARVDIPGEEGDFGVMAGHAPFMSTLRPGIVTVHGGGTGKKIFVHGGFCEVTQTSCVILAEEAFDPATVDKEALQKKIQNAREDVEDAKTDDQKAHAQAALQNLEAIAANLA